MFIAAVVLMIFAPCTFAGKIIMVFLAKSYFSSFKD